MMKGTAVMPGIAAAALARISVVTAIIAAGLRRFPWEAGGERILRLL